MRRNPVGRVATLVLPFALPPSLHEAEHAPDARAAQRRGDPEGDDARVWISIHAGAEKAAAPAA